jgi:hypothetical protein
VDNLSVFFLAQGEQPADAVMARLTTFVRVAKQTLDLAVYDMRFSDPLRVELVSALRERADAGVQIRFCYDGDKPPQPNVAAGQDPAPTGTGAFVQSLGYPWRRIGGMKLMHSKFVLRDRQTVWTGSANMTDDAFTLMENNILEIDSSALTNYYAQDFEQIWEIEKFRPTWWQRLINCALWLLLPALGLIAYALYLGETENLTVSACVWQFPLIAVGMAALLVCAVSPRLPLCRIAIPGAAFIASIAYSAYLIQKLVINGVEQFCSSHNIRPTSALALVGVELCVYAAATLLFLFVERPFLQLRKRLAPRK